MLGENVDCKTFTARNAFQEWKQYFRNIHLKRIQNVSWSAVTERVFGALQRKAHRDNIFFVERVFYNIDFNELCANPEMLNYLKLFGGVVSFLKEQHFGKYTPRASKKRIPTDIEILINPDDFILLSSKGVNDEVISDAIEYAIRREIERNSHEFEKMFERKIVARYKQDISIQQGTVVLKIGFFYNGRVDTSHELYKVQSNGTNLNFCDDQFLSIGKNKSCSISGVSDEECIAIFELSKKDRSIKNVFRHTNYEINSFSNPENILLTHKEIVDKKTNRTLARIDFTDMALAGEVGYTVHPNKTFDHIINTACSSFVRSNNVQSLVLTEIGVLKRSHSEDYLYINIDGSFSKTSSLMTMAKANINGKINVVLMDRTGRERAVEIKEGTIEVAYKGTVINEIIPLIRPQHIPESYWQYSLMIIRKYGPCRKFETLSCILQKDGSFEIVNNDALSEPPYLFRNNTFYTVWQRQELKPRDILFVNEKVYLVSLPKLRSITND